MKILLVNDDGIYAPGLRSMAASLQELGEVHVVAPLVEQSGVGHRITYLHPILIKDIREEGEHYGWAVDGSPADCVKMGVLELCRGEPDLIVSGINSGANVGINVLYSGTVAAAMEGTLLGYPSIALSQIFTPPEPVKWQTAERHAAHVIAKLMSQTDSSGEKSELKLSALE